MKKKEDLVAGHKYGSLTYLYQSRTNKYKQKIGMFKCDCGETKEIRTSLVSNSRQKTCGAAIHRKEFGKKRRNAYTAGAKYNKLTFVKCVSYNKNNSAVWLCRCDCGTEKEIVANYVKRGQIKSCGCLDSAIDLQRKKIKQKKEHDTWLAGAKIIYGTYKDGNLSFEEFLALSQMKCHYCGSLPSAKCHPSYRSNGEKRKKSHKNKYQSFHDNHPDAYFVYNGLDRLSSLEKHNKDNVVSCCAICNTMKMDLSYNSFLNHIQQIFSYRVIKDDKLMEKTLINSESSMSELAATKNEADANLNIAEEEIDQAIVACENCAAPSDGVSLDDVPLCDECGENLTGGDSISMEEAAEKNFIDQQVRSYRAATQVVDWLTPQITYSIVYPEKDLTEKNLPGCEVIKQDERHLISSDWFSGSWPLQEALSLKGFLSKLSPHEKDLTTEESPPTIFSSSIQGDLVGCEAIKQGDPKNGVYYPLLTLEEVQKLLDEGREAREKFEQEQRKLRWTKCLYCNFYMDSCKCKAV